MSSKGRRDRSEKDSKNDPGLESGNPIRKQIDEIVKRISTENQAFEKILKEIDNKNED